MALRITREDSRGKDRTLPRISMPKECMLVVSWKGLYLDLSRS
ncbi:hypothetical protein ACFL6B_01410 [Thermodesulfobacteriota bacterium]